jgi:formylglycine-generating enzyme required for sulfatase activity
LAKFPVTGLSWYEAAAYATWKGQRLPTFAEWEIGAGAPNLDELLDKVWEYPFDKLVADREGVVAPREVGTASWAVSSRNCSDMGSNVAEWTADVRDDGKSIVKGSEPGLGNDLFHRYARRAKNSVADRSDRSPGRGFRCIETFSADSGKDDDAEGN